LLSDGKGIEKTNLLLESLYISGPRSGRDSIPNEAGEPPQAVDTVTLDDRMEGGTRPVRGPAEGGE
jgi:hypothetical protein